LALTSYTNYPFNSMTNFNGVLLAAGNGGVFIIGGALDEAAVINAIVRTGLTDFSTERTTNNQITRITDAYVNVRTDGEMTLKVITEGGEYDYPVRAKEGFYPNRVPLGKGAKSKHWQFEISNVEGADFDLNSLAVTPVKTQRRA